MPAPLDYEAWIDRAARLHPDRVAVDAKGGSLTNAELAAAAQAVAATELAELRRGDEVAIALPSGIAFAIALHACWIAGLVAVPEDLRLPDAQRAERTATCAARIASVAQVWPDELLAVPAAASAGPTDRGPLPSSDTGPRSVGPPGAAPKPIAGSRADAATPAVRLSTSGTTGPGTPVQLSRGALLWNAIGSAAALGQPPGERWLSAMPVSHVGGLTVLARSAIGATTAVLRPRFDPEEQLGLLMDGQATITSMVPTMLGRLLDAGLDHPPNLRLVLLGGGPIPPSLVDRAAAAGVPVAATYGLSEACSQVFTAGAPLFCTDVVLRGELAAGAEATEDPAAAEEILVRGPTLATGVADAAGWLATGDRGRRDAGGRFSVVGRLAETIVTGGENVAPTEVEAHLLALPWVADAAVLGVADAEWGERLEARVVVEPGHDLDPEATRVALRAVLPPFAVPKAVTAVASLPRTPTGKLIRRELG